MFYGTMLGLRLNLKESPARLRVSLANLAAVELKSSHEVFERGHGLTKSAWLARIGLVTGSMLHQEQNYRCCELCKAKVTAGYVVPAADKVATAKVFCGGLASASVQTAVETIASKIANRHISDELYGWRDAGENGLGSGPAARAPGYRVKHKPVRKRDAAYDQANPLMARTAVKKAAEAEEKAAREAAKLEVEKIRLTLSKAKDAAARTARMMQRRGSTEGVGHDTPKVPTLPPEPINMGIRDIIHAAVKAQDMHIRDAHLFRVFHPGSHCSAPQSMGGRQGE